MIYVILVIGLIPRTLAMLLTYKCNFLCSHCSVNASPYENRTMDFSIVKKAIDEAYEIPSLYVVSFTGGEPTLYPNLLLKSIEYAHNAGFVTRLVTNAWWASSINYARKIIGKMSDKGLDELNISFDDFHIPWLKKYGGEYNIVNAIKAGLENNLRVAISIVRAKNSTITKDYLQKMFKRYGIEHDDIIIIEDYVNRLGRGKHLPDYIIPKTKYNKIKTKIRDPCEHIGTALAIHPDGTVMACCGHIIRTDAAWLVTLGNIRKESLKSLIRRMWRNALFWWLRVYGPYSLLSRIRKLSGENHYIDDKKIVGRCEICYILATKYKHNLIEFFNNKNKNLNQILLS